PAPTRLLVSVTTNALADGLTVMLSFTPAAALTVSTPLATAALVGGAIVTLAPFGPTELVVIDTPVNGSTNDRPVVNVASLKLSTNECVSGVVSIKYSRAAIRSSGCSTNRIATPVAIGSLAENVSKTPDGWRDSSQSCVPSGRGITSACSLPANAASSGAS